MTSTKADRLVRVDNREEKRDRGNLEDLKRFFRGIPFLNGRLIEDIDIGNGSSAQVQHRLTKTPKGWLVVDVDAAIDLPLYRSSWDQNFITIENPGTVDVTIAIWVFA